MRSASGLNFANKGLIFANNQYCLSGIFVLSNFKTKKMEITNNTILITGGSSGIGLQFATQLINLGNTVIITGRNQAKLDEIKNRLPKAHIFKSDVSDPLAIIELFKKVILQFPTLNILINNAGEMRNLNLLDTSITVENVNREIAINLSGPVWMVQQFLPHLQKQKTAAIVNVSSALAYVPFALSPVYSATKSGLHAYTQALRIRLKKTNIKVFELLAPLTNTPLGDKFAGDFDSKMMMEPDKVVAIAIKGLMKDKFEILPGMAIMLKLISRLAPKFILKQMGKVAEKSWAQEKL